MAGVLVLALFAGALLGSGALGGGGVAPHRGAAHAPLGTLRLVAGQRAVSIPTAVYLAGGQLRAAALAAAVRARVPARVHVRVGTAVITVAYDRAQAIRRAADLGSAGGSVLVAGTPVASIIDAPVIGQVMRNDCEATALSIVLAALGRHVDQRVLQAQLPRSGPVDPSETASGRVWGDPELGFVGRPDGGGSAGGFGVYQRPVRAVALRHGVALTDITGTSPARIRARLLGGHPILAWVALSDGPYATWRSPAGRPVTVNIGEHAVALTGIGADGTVRVNDPLTGAIETWTAADFARKWALMGRRALSA